MPLRTWGDFQRAFELGKFHIQRIFKNTGTSTTLGWLDNSYASGQPLYDAHIGTNPLTFFPCVATGNKAIYYPDIPSDEHRYLVSVSLRGSQGSYLGPPSIVIFDLLGYYPMIDGDDDSTQVMDNTTGPLPRHTDGIGVIPVLVNHISPIVQAGVAIIEYVDSSGTTRTTTVAVSNQGINRVCSGMRSTNVNDIGNLSFNPNATIRGVRQINSVRFTTLPGGMFCLYLIRILATIVGGDNNLFIEKDFITKQGCRAPRILDGAWICWFHRLVSGTATGTSWFGDFTFAWG